MGDQQRTGLFQSSVVAGNGDLRDRESRQSVEAFVANMKSEQGWHKLRVCVAEGGCDCVARGGLSAARSDYESVEFFGLSGRELEFEVVGIDYTNGVDSGSTA